MNDFKDIKIVFCDIDGTLVDDNKRISEITIEAFKKIVNKGIYVVLVSGRDHIHTIQRSKIIGASSFVICSNGALIYDYKDENVIYLDRIDANKIKNLFDYCSENKYGFLIKALSGKYFNKYLTYMDEEIDKYISIDNNDNFNNIAASQLLLVGSDYDKTLKAQDYVKSLGLEVTNFSESFLDKKSDRYTFDINNIGTNKGKAITYLLSYLKIEKSQSICFGDFVNDLDMFDACGIKVAMQNAHPVLKEKADYITNSNNENGVANFLNKYL